MGFIILLACLAAKIIGEAVVSDISVSAATAEILSETVSLVFN